MPSDDPSGETRPATGLSNQTYNVILTIWAVVLALLVLGGGAFWLWELAVGRTQLDQTIATGLTTFVGIVLLAAGQYINSEASRRRSVETQHRIDLNAIATQMHVDQVTANLHDGLKEEISTITANKVSATAVDVARQLAQDVAARQQQQATQDALVAHTAILKELVARSLTPPVAPAAGDSPQVVANSQAITELQRQAAADPVAVTIAPGSEPVPVTVVPPPSDGHTL